MKANNSALVPAEYPSWHSALKGAEPGLWYFKRENGGGSPTRSWEIIDEEI
jgi:hypothetical protein